LREDTPLLGSPFTLHHGAAARPARGHASCGLTSRVAPRWCRASCERTRLSWAHLSRCTTVLPRVLREDTPLVGSPLALHHGGAARPARGHASPGLTFRVAPRCCRASCERTRLLWAHLSRCTTVLSRVLREDTPLVGSPFALHHGAAARPARGHASCGLTSRVAPRCCRASCERTRLLWAHLSRCTTVLSRVLREDTPL